MHTDGGDHLVTLSVNNANVVGICVNHVDLIFLAVSRDPGRVMAYINGPEHVKPGQGPRSHVDNTHGVVLAIGYVRVFTVKRPVIRQGTRTQIPPRQAPSDSEDDKE